jgi:flagellar capping protein FliD
MFMGHSLGLDDNYFKPSENDVLEEYLAAVDWLTINEENRLKKQVKELTKKQDEIEVMKERHEQEIKDIHEQMDHIMLMIQQNPTLAQVKPEALVKKQL